MLELKTILGTTLIAYLVFMYGICLLAQDKVHDVEDYLVAGRSLPLSLSWMTLLATWFGAGTLLTATDEVRQGGVSRAALDPFGAGVCLILAGLLFAPKLWSMKLFTMADFYRIKFGPRAETMSALVMLPGYFGWIAAQFVALAGVLHLFFELDPAWGIPLVAVVGMGYTLLGGMWSVTLTDAIQITLVLIGLIVLGFTAVGDLGEGSFFGGLSRIRAETAPDRLRPIPLDDVASFRMWMSAFLVGALGNLPGQDLMQRVFAAKSARVARQACILAGVMYLLFGMIPVTLGLVGGLVLDPGQQTSVLPALAARFLSPMMAVILMLAIMSAVLSTIDSAILAPASVLAQNVFLKMDTQISNLALNRFAVCLVTAVSLVLALMGENAYSLLESAYGVGLAALLVPMVMGVYTRPRGGAPALASMGVGIGLWFLHLVLGWKSFLPPLAGDVVPSDPGIAIVGLLVYMAIHVSLPVPPDDPPTDAPGGVATSAAPDS